MIPAHVEKGLKLALVLLGPVGIVLFLHRRILGMHRQLPFSRR
jgi:hypothetical protein